MANEPGGSKWWSDADIRTVEDYLHVADDRGTAIQELRELAVPNVEHISWLNNLITIMNNNTLGSSQGLGY